MSETLIQSSSAPSDADRPASTPLSAFTKADPSEQTNPGASLSGPLLDSLTGLGNRRQLDLCIERALLHGQGDDTLTLILIDLDRFGTIKETFGDPLGNAVLCLVAGRLQHAAKEADVIARLGHHEFAILLRNADAEMAVGDLDALLGAAFVINGQAARVARDLGLPSRTGGTASPRLI